MKNDRGRTPTIPIRPAYPGAPAPGDPDTALLRRMADGDDTALAALYDRWGDRVHTVAFWVLKDGDEAEDVVEETFWQMWRSAGRFDPGRASATSWITMIARSRALDRLRAQRRRIERTAAGAGMLLEELAEPEPFMPDARVAEALDALPAEQREALELAFFRGLSQAEIAVHTGLPLGTVKTRIRLAMDKLRARLGNLRDHIL